MMMKDPAYPAARIVAPTVEAYFARHRAEARRHGQLHVAPIPDAEAIEAIIDAAFWASLRREEDFVPRISLAFLTPAEAVNPLIFERPLSLDAAALTKVAPAVERSGIHLGVSRDGDELSVWGTTRTIPMVCFVLEVAAPGLLVIKHHRGEESGKFVNVAVLEGDQVKFVDEHASSLPDCSFAADVAPRLRTAPASWGKGVSWCGLGERDGAARRVDARARPRRLAARRAGGRRDVARVDHASHSVRGVAAVFPSWRRSGRETPDAERQRGWQEALVRAVDAIAGLTAVDGAAVITAEYDLLAFGAKIARRKGWPQIEHVTMTEPIEGGEAVRMDPAQLGGTHVTCRRRSSSRISATQLPSSRRRIASSPSSPGRRARRWCTPTASRRCCSDHRVLMNVPSRSSDIASCSSALVLITIGPYHATGSSIGFPETSRNLMP